MALTDALDDLISEGRIAPQLAMKILTNFDRHVTEVLADKVKANLTFKVRPDPFLFRGAARGRRRRWWAADGGALRSREISIPTASATRCGRS